jgi:hypothetical protein
VRRPVAPIERSMVVDSPPGMTSASSPRGRAAARRAPSRRPAHRARRGGARSRPAARARRRAGATTRAMPLPAPLRELLLVGDRLHARAPSSRAAVPR